MNNRATGIRGEITAAEYLKNKGYKIIALNYTNSIGEIDIIATKELADGESPFTKMGINTITVFVEVKARATAAFGLPREAVTYYKQQQVRRVATLWLRNKGLLDSMVRFDVIEILGNQITHFEDAF